MWSRAILNRAMGYCENHSHQVSRTTGLRTEEQERGTTLGMDFYTAWTKTFLHSHPWNSVPGTRNRWVFHVPVTMVKTAQKFEQVRTVP